MFNKHYSSCIIHDCHIYKFMSHVNDVDQSLNIVTSTSSTEFWRGGLQGNTHTHNKTMLILYDKPGCSLPEYICGSTLSCLLLHLLL